MNYIPDHLKQIENLLSNLSLKTPITPKEFIQYTKSFGNKHRFYSPCFNKDGQQYFFYALLKKDAESKKQFSKELRLANFLKNYKNGFSHNFPDYVNYSIGNAHPWLLSSFIPFKTLENPIKIERLSQNLSDEDILMIGKSLFEINYNFLNYAIGFLEITINDLSLKTDSTIAKLNRFVQEGIVDRKLIVRIKDYLQTNSSLVHNQTKYFCHGDFLVFACSLYWRLQLAKIMPGRIFSILVKKQINLPSADQAFSFDIPSLHDYHSSNVLAILFFCIG